MSFLDVIAEFATEGDEPGGEYLVERSGPTTYGNDGREIDGPTTTFTIVACVQPTTGRDLRVLVEAGITTESKVIYTESELRTRQNGGEPDVVTIRGERYAVYNAKTWDTPEETYYRCLVARQSMQ